MIEYRDDSSVILVKSNATDIDVARAAWVSTAGADAREKDGARVPGLINFLMRERHGTPFENAGNFVFLITTPIFVIREFHRHRIGWSYNELSGRYTELKPVFYLPNRHRKILQTGKVGSYHFELGVPDQYDLIEISTKEVCEKSWARYQQMISAGIAKEVARMVLPLNIYSTFYASCNARSLMNFLSLRTSEDGSGPLAEIEAVARDMENYFASTMPHTYKSWAENGRVAP